MILVFILLTQNGSCQNQCEELKCGRHGPVVRFPFRIKDRHPVDCGYPGFDITCSDHDQLLLDLPTPSGPVSLSVRNIYYRSRKIELFISKHCFPLNCSDNQDMFSCPIHVAASTDQFLGSNILFCTKMIEISSNQLYNIQKNALNLSWSKPNCTRCEIKGQMCKLKNNGTKDDIECLDYDHKKQISTRIAVAVTTSGSVMILLVLVGLFLLHRHFKLKGEDRVRLEKFLEDYRSLKPTRFSYADLHRMTSGFKDTLGEGAHGSVFKGKLSEEILVAVKMLNNSEVDHGKEFINEVGAIDFASASSCSNFFSSSPKLQRQEKYRGSKVRMMNNINEEN
ncbi:putative RING-H2 finger protein ATL21A [Prosopis cineraria]|uniref:putative RING-H2 finger protein ATL21A n=1 Tax=Prosopis cineraria TaxID=364024 RepID=UPI00240FF32F|nr:putative RING-H2 finger protein ATL21A [Prosopis cineraria]